MHALHKRCDECGRINVFRRPHHRNVERILPFLPCHYCHPDKLKDCCISCRYPLAPAPTSTARRGLNRPPTGTVFRHASTGLCETCYMIQYRRREKEEQAKPAPPA
jgi:hypothetical protein